MSFIKIIAFALLATLSQTLPSTANQFVLGELVIDHPYTRATPPNAKVAGGYLTITNNGNEADRFIAASAEFSDRVEIHKMEIKNDIMKMMPIPEGLEIPAGGSVELKPGSFHLMFMSISSPLVEGEMQKVTLEFEKSGKVEISLAIVGFNGKASHDMQKHGDMKTKHKASE